ncbi:MAG TPA: hypothetical protein VLZ74_11100 [Methylocella sp.]|nr:hypothetical protein [Methylocella sp.]
MRVVVAALCFVSVIYFAGYQSAGAVPVEAAAINETASTVMPTEQVRYHRHYIVKCYHELVVGPYRCHRYYRWWW